MDKDDDDDEEKSVNVTRYAVMPSLASLRLMRNRLHLAALGKKLMKWTAISTGRESRKLAGLLLGVYETFSKDMIEAYIKLARSRYFYPTLNDRVLEHCPPQAKITVSKAVKTGAGVKLTQVVIQDSGIDGYEHLGIDKGGQCIKDTKEAWERLLKKIIMILQFKTSFLQVEAAHKNATKKVNVLQRVQIPRICMTVRYILTELDEQEREEMFRLKRFKEKKHKKKAPAEVKPEIQEIETIKKLVETTLVEIMEPEEMSIEPDVELIVPEAKSIQPEVKSITPEIPSKQIVIRVPLIKVPEVKVPELKIPELKEIKKNKSDVCGVCDTCAKASDSQKQEKEKKLELLKKHLQETIMLSRKFLEEGFKNGNGQRFISTCNEARQKIDQLVEDKDQTSAVDKKLKDRLEHLKRHLHEVIEVTRDFCDESLSPNFENPCAHISEEKSPCCLQESIQKMSIGTESRMEELKNHIEDIVTLIEDYKNEGLLSESVEAFLRSCDHVKSKISIYVKEIDEALNQRLEFLRKQVTFVEESANYINQEGMQDFLCSCKNFKGKLDKYKGKGQKPPAEGGLAELVTQIKKTIELSQEAQKGGFQSENLNNFLKSCDDMKTHIESKCMIETKEQPKCLKQLKSNINDVMELVSKCRAEGTLTESAEAFIQSCEKAKTKIDCLGKQSVPSDNDKQISIGSCTCSHSEKTSDEILCDKCMDKIRTEPVAQNLKPPCDYCSSSFYDVPTEKVMHNTCLQDPFDDVDWLSYISTKLSDENTCELCKRSTKENIDKEHQDHLPEGYLHVVTKIKRTHHPDGLVKEVRETITIKNEKNKHLATLSADDQDEHRTCCIHEPLFDSEKKVNTCITSNQNQSGFKKCKKATSENIVSNAPMAEPCSKQCISMNNLTSMNKNLHSTDNFSNETSDFLIDLIESTSKNSKSIWKNKPSSSKKND